MSTQGQAGCGSEQPGLVVGDPAHRRGGLELDDHYGPFQPRPFYDLNAFYHSFTSNNMKMRLVGTGHGANLTVFYNFTEKN